jgi:hypothetical protein
MRGTLMLLVACLAAAVGAQAQDAPMEPPRYEPLPAQRVGDVIVEGAVMPVWTAPALDARPPMLGQQVTDPAVLARIPPPPARRRDPSATLDGVAARPEWRDSVQAGHAVPLAAAVVRIAPPGLKAPTFDGVDAATLQAPVSWAAGLDRATALEGVLRAQGLRAVVNDLTVVVARVARATQPALDDAAAWRQRAAELDAAAQEARRAEVAMLAREREELEARRLAAELQLRELQQETERQQQQHRSRLASMEAGFSEREWRMSPKDATLRQGLERWARLEGVGFAWEADVDLPVLADLAYRGPLPAVLDRLLDRVPSNARLIYSLDRRQGLVVRRSPAS